MNSLWADKYKPKKSADYINLENQVINIKKYLKCFKKQKPYKNFKNGLLVTGKSGTGKSGLIETILKEEGFSVLNFNASTTLSNNEITSKIKAVLTTNNILRYISNIKNTAIIIDELDAIDSKKEFGSSNIIDLLSHSKTRFYDKLDKKVKKTDQMFMINKTPIICISNGNYSKKLKKACIHITIPTPSNKNIATLLDNILYKEKFNLEEPIKHLIVAQSFHDYRQSILILEDVIEFIKCGGYDKNKIIKKIFSIGNKDISEDIYTYTESIFTNKHSFDELSNMHSIYNKNIFLITYENIFSIINKCFHLSYKKQLEACIKLSKSFLLANVFQKQLFNKWELRNYIVLFLAELNEYCYPNNIQSNKLPYIEHSLIISKYNYRFYNLKYINRLSKKLDIDIRNFFMLSYLFYHIVFISKDEKAIEAYIRFVKKFELNNIEFFKIIKLTLLPENISITKRLENKFKKLFIKFDN